MEKLTKDEKRQRRQDHRTYHAAAVLDRASSDRVLKPLPGRLELRGADGRALTVTLDTATSRPAFEAGGPAGRSENSAMTTRWTTRPATADDAARIAAHGAFRPEDASRRAAYEAWVRPRLEAGLYLGWLAEAEGRVVGGAGAVLLDWGPTRANPGGTMARIVNVFVDEDWRRQGLARALVGAVLARCEGQGVREFNLGATPEGRDFYASLGFEPYAAEMRRRVPAPR